MGCAEDNGFDAYDLWDICELQEQREDFWRKGYHFDRKGKRHELKDMSLQHLKNTHRLFSERGYDTGPLLRLISEHEKRIQSIR